MHYAILVRILEEVMRCARRDFDAGKSVEDLARECFLDGFAAGQLKEPENHNPEVKT